MEAGAREPALPAMTELLRVDHLEKSSIAAVSVVVANRASIV